MKTISTYIVLDLEYCYTGMAKNTPRPTHKDDRQIVQIAAILYDIETGTELDMLNIIVKPTYLERVGNFFTELTGIDQETVDNGTSLERALDQLESFIGNHPVLTYDKDWFVLHQNVAYIDYEVAAIARPFIRVKHLLHLYDIDSNQYSSGSLYKAVGLDIDGHVHNALHDVRSMARALSSLVGQHNLPIETANTLADSQTVDECAVVGRYS